MKNYFLYLILVSAIIFLSCAFTQKKGDARTQNKNVSNKSTNTTCEANSDSLIKSFLKDSICMVIENPDYVFIKKIVHKIQIDSLRKDSVYFNVEDSVGLMDKRRIGFLQYILLSDSTWNWSKIKIKHAFEPEIVSVFVKDKSTVNVIMSPASLEMGFGYTNILIKKEYKSDPVINRFINDLQKTKPKTSTSKLVKTPKKKDSINN